MSASGARESTSFAALSAWATGMAVVQAVTVLTGITHVVMTRALAWMVIAGAVTAGVAVWRPLAPGVAWASRPWTSWRWIGAFLLVLTLLEASLVVSGWAKPDLSFDGCTYHVPTIHFWSERGYVCWIEPAASAGAAWRAPVDALLNAFPKGAELVGFVLVRAFGRSEPANLLTFPFLPLGVLGIACIARLLGAAQRVALAAGLSYLLVPINVSQSVTTYVDAAYASCVIGWLAAMLATLDATIDGAGPWRTLPAAASTMGLALATKASGSAPVGVGLAVLAVASLVAARHAGVLSSLRRVGGFVVVPLALGALVGGYWYARNWMHTGNPLFPVRMSILGHEVFPGTPLDVVIAESGNTPVHLRSLSGARRVLETWTQSGRSWPDSVRFYDAREGGLGFLWLLAGLPSLAILAVRAARGRMGREGVMFGVLALTTSVSFVAMPMHWWSRYTLWVHGAGLPATAAVAALAMRARWSRVAGGAWLVLISGMVARESFVAFRWAATASCFIGEPQPIGSPAAYWRALTTYDDGWSFFHELRGHPLALEALVDGGTIAISPLSVTEAGILGVAGSPAGTPRIVLLDDALLRNESALRDEVEHDHIAWVFYGEHLPPSAALARLARREERVDPLWTVYDMRTTR